MSLAAIETIIIVMLENRSFDHMLGYLSLDETADPLAVDGLRSDKAWRNSYANIAATTAYNLHRLSAIQSVKDDPPHDCASIKLQISTAAAGPGRPQMGGFVQSFLKGHPNTADPGAVMGYYDGDTLRAYDFLARNFCVCDHWYASLPLGTQANRLMAMAGESRVVDNVTPLPDQALVYDWLNKRQLAWRVYVSGGYAPFFLMMRRWAPSIVESIALGNGNFKRFGAFAKEWTSKRPFPNVVFIEPEYQDAPLSHPNDDHPPAPVSRGQDFIWQIYNILISNPARWNKTLMIVTYDEHGGFFDHASPRAAPAAIGATTFTTTGVRVPALLISPYVQARQVFSEPLDHTSILQLLAERFAPDKKYSDVVSARQQHFGRIANALGTEPRTAIPRAPAPRMNRATAAPSEPGVPCAPQTPNAAAIDSVAREMLKQHPEWMNMPQWQKMKQYLETNPPAKPLHHGRIN